MWRLLISCLVASSCATSLILDVVIPNLRKKNRMRELIINVTHHYFALNLLFLFHYEKYGYDIFNGEHGRIHITYLSLFGRLGCCYEKECYVKPPYRKYVICYVHIDKARKEREMERERRQKDRLNINLVDELTPVERFVTSISLVPFKIEYIKHKAMFFFFPK